MPVSFQGRIVCDQPRCWLMLETHDVTNDDLSSAFNALLAEATKDGWLVASNGKVFCPEHAPKIANSKLPIADEGRENALEGGS